MYLPEMTHETKARVGVLSSKMRYEEIVLSIEQDEARNHIADHVSDLRVTTSDGKIEYRTNAGIRLAVLSDATLPSGEKGSKLRYRTTLITPSLAHARTKARTIRRAVENYKID